MTRSRLLPALLLPAVLAAGAAWAHAHLKAAEPAANAVLAAPPAAASLLFSEAVEPRLSSIEVRNAAGERVDARDLAAPPGEPMRLRVSLPALPPGRYSVVWRAVSVDTHRTEGRYSFTIRP